MALIFPATLDQVHSVLIQIFPLAIQVVIQIFPLTIQVVIQIFRLKDLVVIQRTLIIIISIVAYHSKAIQVLVVRITTKVAVTRRQARRSRLNHNIHRQRIEVTTIQTCKYILKFVFKSRL